MLSRVHKTGLVAGFFVGLFLLAPSWPAMIGLVGVLIGLKRTVGWAEAMFLLTVVLGVIASSRGGVIHDMGSIARNVSAGFLLLFTAKNSLASWRRWMLLIGLGVFLALDVVHSTGIAAVVYFVLFFFVWQLPEQLFFDDTTEVIEEVLLIVFVASLVLWISNPDRCFLMGRLRGVFGNPNEFGLFLTPLLFYLGTGIRQGQWQKMLLFVSGLVCVYYTGSRTTLVCLLGATSLHFGAAWFQGGVVRLSSRLLFISTFALLFLLSPLWNVMSQGFRFSSAGDFGGRIHAWKLTMATIPEHLFFGCGAGCTNASLANMAELLALDGHIGGVHSAYLLLANDFGLVGIFVVLLSLVLSVVSSIRLSFPILFMIGVSSVSESWLEAPLSVGTLAYILVISVWPKETVKR